MYIVIKGPPQCGKPEVGQMGNNFPWEQPLIIWLVMKHPPIGLAAKVGD